MKLIIQIPCLNEEKSLPIALASLPKSIEGISEIEILIIDDGSTDRTVEVAKSLGVQHVVKFPTNRGLAAAFSAGLDACLEAGADIIVNTDADNQYEGSDIPKLVAPILRGEAEIVIGERPISKTRHFSLVKKILQKLGSWVVRVASKTDIRDAPSGFRAINRRAAMQLKVFSRYTYTLETIIQAGRKGISIISVPINTNEDLRPSRLVRSIPTYVRRSILTIMRIFMTYRPFSFFTIPGVISFMIGLAIGMRFLYFFLTEGGAGHIQSVILAALLMGAGIFLIVTGLLADLISVNRQLMEKIDLEIKTIRYDILNKK